jgi:hypothetical protein
VVRSAIYNKNSAENNVYDEDNVKEAVEPAKKAVAVI